LYLILIGVFQQMVVCNGGQVVKLEIIDIHRKPLFDMLLDVVVYDGVGFSRAGSTKYNRGSKRIYDINPSIVPFAFVIKLCGKIDRVFIFYQTGFLLETLVFIIENIVHQIVAEWSAHPYPCHEQGYISQTRCKDVKRCGNTCRQL